MLSSWKEIANYLGKGVRTVQRWERQMSLPVHRPSGCDKGVVLAYTDELDRWVHIDGGRAAQESPDIDIRIAVKESVSEGNALRAQCVELRTEHHEAVKTLVTNLQNMTQLLAEARRHRDELAAISLAPPPA